MRKNSKEQICLRVILNTEKPLNLGNNNLSQGKIGTIKTNDTLDETDL